MKEESLAQQYDEAYSEWQDKVDRLALTAAKKGVKADEIKYMKNRYKKIIPPPIGPG